MNTYPILDQFMGAYLHLDYDLNTGSNDINDAIDLYFAETSNDELLKLTKEIELFESKYKSDLDQQFETHFSPGITIDSVKAFFELVKSKIQKHLEQST